MFPSIHLTRTAKPVGKILINPTKNQPVLPGRE